MGERLNGIQEVVGSIPISSTKEYKNGLHYAARFFIIGRLMGFHVYVLKSDSGHSYIGQSKHLDTRVAEHNSGKSKATKGKGPWRLAYSEEFEIRAEAMKREKYFKTQIGRLWLKEQAYL
ncbi:hypothetical protein LCGC14_2235740 [marine sediment metagenome]|uniref:GIY-YIG domain-containing protein n=1 Tax=marine sediment metagenome TaxID=412755 RepID=A0A0F9DUH2_9ZZZZ